MKKDEKEKNIADSLEIIKKLVDKGFSNYKIAKDTGITDRTIGNYVNGDTKPTLANARIIIDYFNKTNSINITGDSNMTNTGITGGDVIIGADQEVKSLRKRVKELEEEIDQLKKDKAILHELVTLLQNKHK